MNIYLLDVSPFSNSFIFKKYYKTCPEYRKKKIDLLKNNNDRMRSLGVEVLLAYGMQERNALPYDISIAPNGKPFAANLNVSFSLSHSGKYAVAAFSDNEIGIDIESRENVDLTLIERYFSKAEQEQVRNSEDDRLEFLKIWTRKEALIKATDKGIQGKLSDICTVPDKIDFFGKTYSVFSFEQSDCVISVAYLGENAPTSVEHIIVT